MKNYLFVLLLTVIVAGCNDLGRYNGQRAYPTTDLTVSRDHNFWTATQVVGGADWENTGNQGIAVMTQNCEQNDPEGSISVMTGNDDATLTLAYELTTAELIPRIDAVLGTAITHTVILESVAIADINIATDSIPDLVFGMVAAIADTQNQGITVYKPFMGVVLNNATLTLYPDSIIVTDLLGSGNSSSQPDYRIAEIAQLEDSTDTYPDIIALVSTAGRRDGRCNNVQLDPDFLAGSYVARFSNDGTGELPLADSPSTIYPSSGTIAKATDMIYFKYQNYNYLVVSQILDNSSGENQIDVLMFSDDMTTQDTRLVPTPENVQPFFLGQGDIDVEDEDSTPKVLVAVETTYDKNGIWESDVAATRVLFFDPTDESPSTVYLSNSDTSAPSTLYIFGEPLALNVGSFGGNDSNPEIALLVGTSTSDDVIDLYCPTSSSAVHCPDLPARLVMIGNLGNSAFVATENQALIWDDIHPVLQVDGFGYFQMASSDIDEDENGFKELLITGGQPNVEVFRTDSETQFTQISKNWGAWKTRNGFGYTGTGSPPYIFEGPFYDYTNGDMGDLDHDGTPDAVFPIGNGCNEDAPSTAFTYLTIFWGCGSQENEENPYCQEGDFFVKDQCSDPEDDFESGCPNSERVFGTTNLRIPCNSNIPIVSNTGCSPWSVNIEDFNNDGDNDILVGVTYHDGNREYLLNKVIVFLGDERISGFGNTGNPFNGADDGFDLDNPRILHFYVSGSDTCDRCSTIGTNGCQAACEGKAFYYKDTDNQHYNERAWLNRSMITNVDVGDFNHDHCNDIVATIFDELPRPDYSGEEPNTVRGVVLLLQTTEDNVCTGMQEPSQLYPDLLWLQTRPTNQAGGAIFVTVEDIDQDTWKDDIVSSKHTIMPDSYSCITFYNNTDETDLEIEPGSVKQEYENFELKVPQPAVPQENSGAYLQSVISAKIDDDDCMDIVIAMDPDNEYDYRGLAILWGQGNEEDCSGENFEGFKDIDSGEEGVDYVHLISIGGMINLKLIEYNDNIAIAGSGNIAGILTIFEQVSDRAFVPINFELGGASGNGSGISLAGFEDLDGDTLPEFVNSHLGLNDLVIVSPFDQ